jgi:hypothetical protein
MDAINREAETTAYVCSRCDLRLLVPKQTPKVQRLRDDLMAQPGDNDNAVRGVSPLI